jgi:hypothetical protein
LVVILSWLVWFVVLMIMVLHQLAFRWFASLLPFCRHGFRRYFDESAVPTQAEELVDPTQAEELVDLTDVEFKDPTA